VNVCSTMTFIIYRMRMSRILINVKGTHRGLYRMRILFTNENVTHKGLVWLGALSRNGRIRMPSQPFIKCEWRLISTASIACRASLSGCDARMLQRKLLELLGPCGRGLRSCCGQCARVFECEWCGRFVKCMPRYTFPIEYCKPHVS
jgi:hypothetical protein